MLISYAQVQWFQSYSHPKIFSILGGGHFEKWVKIMFLMQGFIGAFLGWLLGLLAPIILSRFLLYMGYFDQITGTKIVWAYGWYVHTWIYIYIFSIMYIQIFIHYHMMFFKLLTQFVVLSRDIVTCTHYLTHWYVVKNYSSGVLLHDTDILGSLRAW